MGPCTLSHPSYIQKKIRALQKDHRYRNFVYHHRDIMPDCVLKCVRVWFPNPERATFGSKRENALSAGALKGDVNGYFNLQSLKYCQTIHQMVKKKAFIIT